MDPTTLQKRLLLCLYGLGTNTGLKRVSSGAGAESYTDLVYVRRIRKEPFREAIAKVVNGVFRVRLPHIWGEATACEALRREIQEGLNVIENWNGANSFILYGKGGEIATNDLENQELTMLALHLLQICLVYINT